MQRAKTLMYQDFQENDAIEVQYTEQCTAQCTDCTEHYTVDDLVALLSVKRRQIFNLVSTVKQAYFWEPETTFSPSLGKYSNRCLTEIQRLRGFKTSAEYISIVASENQKPVTGVKASASALAIPARQTDLLESRLATIQGNLKVQNSSIQDRMKLALNRISEEKQRGQSNQTTLDEARKQQVAMKATQDALEEHEVYQQVKNAVKEQLLIEELQNQQGQ